MARRVLVTVVLLLPFVGLAFLADLFGALADNVTITTDADHVPDPSASPGADRWWIDLLLAAAAVTWTGLVARRVDYRFHDGLLALIPVVGWLLMTRFFWRASALPERNWPPASERRRAPIDDVAARVTPRRLRAWST